MAKKLKSYLRRNTLNIVLVVLILALLAGAIYLLVSMLRPGSASVPPAEKEELPSPEEIMSPPMQIPNPEDAEPAEPEPTEPPLPEAHTYGSLVLYFDDGILLESVRKQGITLQLPDEKTLPRLDTQILTGNLGDLSEAERERLAVGLLQAYYTDAPATDTVEAEADKTLENAYVLSAEAQGDIPAVQARVRFFQSGDSLLCVILLEARGEEPDEAFTIAFEQAELA